MTHPFEMKGQTFVVTGGASGIGRAAALALVRQGADVVLCDLQPIDDARLAAFDGHARSMVCDVSDRASVAAVHAAFPRIDGLVLSAGILPFDDWTAIDWDASFDRVMGVNVRGVLNMMRAYFPGLCERGHGRVVFVGSASGRMGGMQAGPHYAASKGAVHSLVRWFAQRGAKAGVAVNGIAPGSVATDMLAGQPFSADRVPIGRMATVDEIAWPIAFLCSPAAAFLCGTVMDVNGGLVFS